MTLGTQPRRGPATCETASTALRPMPPWYSLVTSIWSKSGRSLPSTLKCACDDSVAGPARASGQAKSADPGAGSFAFRRPGIADAAVGPFDRGRGQKSDGTYVGQSTAQLDRELEVIAEKGVEAEEPGAAKKWLLKPGDFLAPECADHADQGAPLGL